MNRGDWDQNAVLADAADTSDALEESLPGMFDEDEEEARDRAWLARLPDFIMPDYPFDLPPARLPFAQRIFSLCGAPARCPQETCRRSMRCAGSDGPPCFRADRKPLQQMLFLAWIATMASATDDEARDALRRTKNPYRWAFDEDAPNTRGSRPRRRRRSAARSRAHAPS
jgi:hypothetical protein